MKLLGSITWDESGVVKVQQACAIAVATNRSPRTGVSKHAFLGLPRYIKADKVILDPGKRRPS